MRKHFKALAKCDDNDTLAFVNKSKVIELELEQWEIYSGKTQMDVSIQI